MLIPGGPFEQCSLAGERREPELALLRNQISVQMFRQHASVRAPFVHRCGIIRDAELKQPRLLPDFDGLHEGAGGELAITLCSGARSYDAGSLGISDPCPKEPFAWFRQFR